MALNTAITAAVTLTSTGNQNVTIPGFGTPEVVICVAVHNTSEDAAEDHSGINLGFWDGSRNRSLGVNMQDAVSTTNADRFNEDAIIRLQDGDGSLDVYATITGTVTDGVTINYTTVDAVAHHFYVIFLSGSNFVGYVNDLVHVGAQNTDHDETAPAIATQCVLLGTNAAGGNPGAGGDANFSVGFAVEQDSVVAQRSWNVSRPNNQGNDVAYGRCLENYASWDAFAASGRAAADVKDFDANGFTITKREAAPNYTYQYLAMGLTGAFEFFAGTIDTKTTTGNQAYTGFGFKPQLVILLGSWQDTIESLISTNGKNGAYAIGAMTEDDQACCCVCGDPGQSVTNMTDYFASLTGLAVLNPASPATLGYEATLDSFDSDGMTLNFTTADGTARKVMVLALGAPVATGSAIPASPPNKRANKSLLMTAGKQ